jgi:hypothetical protein
MALGNFRSMVFTSRKRLSALSSTTRKVLPVDVMIVHMPCGAEQPERRQEVASVPAGDSLQPLRKTPIVV